ncbi:MAG: hypothetical protein Q7P63_16975 [Verrucomicrobiota bacterium JB022]|nr:hypothetical protein [Verrucomicrobiota bacterium JB022]
MEAPNPHTDYERHDVGLRLPAIVALGIIVLMAVCLGVLYWIYGEHLYDRHGPDDRLFTHGSAYETPIAADWQEMMEANSGRLDGSAPGTLSLDAAKRRIASQGLPQWSAESDFELQRQETYYDARP